MSNIATVLKQEISRLARKEVRAGTAVTRAAAAQYRRDIARLKRQVQTLTRQVQYLERQERKRAGGTIAPEAAEGRRFSAGGLKKHRNKLGLSAADYGELIGVSAQTVYSWELGKSRPRHRQLAALVAVRELGKRDAVKRLELLAS